MATNRDSYEYALTIVDALNPDQQRAMVIHLTERLAQQRQDRLIEAASTRELTVEEWKALFDMTVIHTPPLADFSNRREDWYGDDGR